MKCIKCGAALQDGDIFCASCGPVKADRICPECDAAVPEGARFCSTCGNAVAARVPKSDVLAHARRETQAATQPGVRPKRPQVFVPVAVVGIACVLAAGMYWIVAGNDSDTQKAAPAKRPPVKAALTPRPADETTSAHGFSMKQAFEKLYGSYDLNLDGAFWKVNRAPRDYAQWNGRTLLIRPLVSRSFDEGGSLRHVIVTNSLDVKDGIVVKQGTGCRTCGALIGVAIFEKQRNGWALISRHDFLAVDGAFGAPPKVAVAFPPDGGIALQFERSHLLDRAPAERSYSIVLKEHKSLSAAMH